MEGATGDSSDGAPDFGQLMRAAETAVEEPGQLAIPRALLHKARRRLGQFALLVTAVIGISIVTSLLEIRSGASALTTYLNFLVIGCGLTLTLSVYAATRWQRIPDERVLDIGLFFEVSLCFLVSVGSEWNHIVHTGLVQQTSWSTPIIVLFPMILQTPPNRTFVAATLAALTAPASVAILGLMGVLQPTGWDYFEVTMNPSFAVILAYFGARIVHGLGMDVARARRAEERARRLGAYQLETLLGRGGMGEVWRARHRMLARPAAVKLVRADLIAGGSREIARQVLGRFEREAQVTATLTSAHTVHVFDFGRTTDGTFYYVMELLRGMDLETMVRKHGPLPPERVIHVLLQVCDSLADAHSHGLVHRDVKPANIFLCLKGGHDDWVKVLDFGLVALPSDTGDPERAITGESVTTGTPAYMAPEMVRGTKAIDGRTDLYSLGCVAYWLLTGQLVFHRKTTLDVILAHIQEPAEPPSQITELDVPDDLEALIMSCLEKDPERRPGSAGALATALRNCKVERPWTDERARQWWATHAPPTTDEASIRPSSD